jgi:hypothetical protein
VRRDLANAGLRGGDQVVDAQVMVTAHGADGRAAPAGRPITVRQGFIPGGS